MQEPLIVCNPAVMMGKPSLELALRSIWFWKNWQAAKRLSKFSTLTRA